MMGVGGVFLYQKQPWKTYTDKFDQIGTIARPGKKPEKQKKAKSKRRKQKRVSRRDDSIDNVDVEIVELSARDRQSISKGPKISLPEKSLDYEKGNLNRSLNENEINAALGAVQNGFIDCIKEAHGSADLKAAIRLRLLVNKKGRIEKKRLTAPRFLFDQGLMGCFGGVTKRMDFKATGAYSVVSIPFDLY